MGPAAVWVMDMRVFGMRIHVIALVFVLALGGALGAQHLFFQQKVHTPLEDRLVNIPGVEAVSLEPSGGFAGSGLTDVRISLEPGVDLEGTYGRIETELNEGLGQRLGSIELVDERDNVLAQAWRDMRFAVQEAIVTGGFREMAREIDGIATEYQLGEWELSMDERFIYLAMERDGAYLYQVISRDVRDDGMGAAQVPRASGLRVR